AIRVLKKYAQRFDADLDASDPLDLRKYVSNYTFLAKDLADWKGPTSIRVAGLLAREFKDKIRGTADLFHWNSLSPEQQNAAFVTYAALGEHKSFGRRFEAETAADEKNLSVEQRWQPKPSNDEEAGAPGFLRNQPENKTALERGGAYEKLWDPDLR
ncbi:MAG: hypothetical protein ACREC6_04755, partial [Hyphomicrobiaceae bacterium]